MRRRGVLRSITAALTTLGLASSATAIPRSSNENEGAGDACQTILDRADREKEHLEECGTGIQLGRRPSDFVFERTMQYSPSVPVRDPAKHGLTTAPFVANALFEAAELDPGQSVTVTLDPEETDRLHEHVTTESRRAVDSVWDLRPASVEDARRPLLFDVAGTTVELRQPDVGLI